MNEKEKCSLCQGSLSGLLNSHGEIVKASEEEMSEISLNELPDADLEKAEYTTQTKENNTIMI